MPTWWFPSLQNATVDGSSTMDSNTAIITVKGAAFDVSKTYYLRFIGLDSDGVVMAERSDSVSSSTASLLLVPAPAFNGREGIVTAELYECSGSCRKMAIDTGSSLAFPEASGIIKTFWHSPSSLLHLNHRAHHMQTPLPLQRAERRPSPAFRLSCPCRLALTCEVSAGT